MTIALNNYNAWRAHTNRDVKNDAQYFKTDNWKIAQEIIELRKHGTE